MRIQDFIGLAILTDLYEGRHLTDPAEIRGYLTLENLNKVLGINVMCGCGLSQPLLDKFADEVISRQQGEKEE